MCYCYSYAVSLFVQQMAYAVGFTLNKLQLFLQSGAEVNEDVDTEHRKYFQTLNHAFQTCPEIYYDLCKRDIFLHAVVNTDLVVYNS